MGIFKFFGQWIVGNYRDVIQNRRPDRVSSLAIDMGGVIHKIAAQVFKYGEKATPRDQEFVRARGEAHLLVEFKNALALELTNIVRENEPTHYLIIAVDGAAPMAKLQQQRQRRFKAAAKRYERNQYFDSSSITTGTSFMDQVSLSVEEWIANNAILLPDYVIFSSHLTPGEGEHKIMEYYKDPVLAGSEGSHILYGKDADLVVLSLISPLGGIYVKREDQEYRGKQQYIDIDKLRTSIQTRLTSNVSSYDFMIMTFLLGNDFIPHPPWFDNKSSSLNAILDEYAVLKLENTSFKLADENGIDAEALISLIDRVATRIPELLIAEYLSNDDNAYRPILEASIVNNIFSYKTYRYLWYQNTLAGVDKAYYPADLPQLARCCNSFMTMIGWCFVYYTKGINGANPNMYYDYLHCPLLDDVADYSYAAPLPDFSICYKTEAQPTINPLQQLLAVLPPSSNSLLPLGMRPLMNEDSVLSPMYPYEFEVEFNDATGNEGLHLSRRVGSDYAAYGIPYIPFADLNSINAALAELTYSPEMERLTVEEHDIQREKSEEERLAQEETKQVQSRSETQFTRYRTNAPVTTYTRGREYTNRGRGRAGAYSRVSLPGRGGSYNRGRGYPRGTSTYNRGAQYRPMNPTSQGFI